MGNIMAGVPPKRSEERRRRNTTNESGVSTEPQQVVVYHDDMEDDFLIDAPEPNPAWHPIAMMHYVAARRSAIREFFEPSDWATLFLLCEQISANMNPTPVVVQSGPSAGEVVYVDQPMPGGTLTAILKGLSSLMFTEGDRRRLRIEVERVAGSAANRETVAAPTGDNVVAIRKTRLEGTA